MIYGLLLITLGVVSAWLLYFVGETDVTGSFFFLLAGLYQITDVIFRNVKKFILK